MPGAHFLWMVLLPALDEAGLRDKNAWASDRRDLQSPASPSEGAVGLLDLLLSGLPEGGGGRQCRRQQLITAVGALGSQLGWSAWVNFYHRHRYVSTAAPVDVPLPKLLEPTAVRTAITLEAEKTPPSPEEKSPHKETTVPFDRPSREEDTSSRQRGVISNRREFVEDLRRREYGRGVELDETANNGLRLLPV
ncbi:hypothetical protein SprV_0200922500 [Sparganum proliferum]